MRYFLAILVPPVAVLLCAKPIQFILNIFLCFFFFLPGVLHALLVVHNHLAATRDKKILAAINRQTEILTAQRGAGR